MSPQRGREGGEKCQNLLSKKTTKGEGGHKIGKMGRRRLWMAPKANLGLCPKKGLNSNLFDALLKHYESAS